MDGYVYEYLFLLWMDGMVWNVASLFFYVLLKKIWTSFITHASSILNNRFIR